MFAVQPRIELVFFFLYFIIMQLNELGLYLPKQPEF